MVSTVTGTDWTSITPIVFTVDSTFTGYAPNPSFDGPTFSPRFSTVVSTSSAALALTTSETMAPVPLSMFR